jgi:uncharacterized protein (TIGR00369 family)
VTPERELVVRWDDQSETAGAATRMSGLEFLRALQAGEVPVPPIQHLMGFAIAEVGEGTITFSGIPGEQHYNPIGVVHGGFAMTLLDSALGASVHTTLALGEAYTTLETKVNLVRPITGTTGKVLCRGEVVHRGGRVATSEARLTVAADGKLLAHGTSTCLVMAGG